ncbi:site-specific DNA-methyltransferase, partial [Staphylococcus epidermidis]
NTKELVNLIGNNKLLLQNIILYGYSFGLEETRELEIALDQLDNKVNLIKRF